MKSEEKKWLVNDRDCKGCRFYQSLSSSGAAGPRYCGCTYMIGYVRKNPPASCEARQEKRIAAR